MPLALPRRAAAVLALVVAGLALTPTAGQAETVRATGHPVVVIGTPGLRWADVDAHATPTLYRLADSSALASMSVRTTVTWTCPVAGWLTLGAGQRASGTLPRPEPDAAPVDEPPPPRCAAPPTPRSTGDGGAVVAEYPALLSSNAKGRYEDEVGLLGDTLEAAGKCVTAVGPGAALAAADARGRVPVYLPGDAAVGADTFTRCPLTVVDAGTVIEPDLAGMQVTPTPRAEQVRAVDQRVGEVLAAVPDDATVLLMGVADSTKDPHLTVTTARGPAPDGESYDEGWLQTRSTRRDALVQLTDVAPTLFALLGTDDPEAAIGSTITPGGGRPPTDDALDLLVDADTKADVARRYTPHFFTVLVASQLLLYGAAAVALRRQWGGPQQRLRVLQAMRRTALAFAAVPVATYLANLVPWWRSGLPLPTLVGSLVACVVVVTAVAQLGPWRRALLGPLGAVALITGLVLLVDVVSGSTLQLSSLMGYSPLVAGRFYGFGNLAFSLFATGMLLGVTAVADGLLVADRRRLAVAVVAVTGAVAVLADGWPRFGSDFGGVIALVPGFAVLGLLVAGARISWLRMALIGVAALATISLVAYLDWRHPAAERSHLGRFVQQVLDGDAATVVERKLEANLRAFRNYLLALIVPIGFAFVVLVLMRPVAWRAAALARAYDRAPTLRLGVIAMLVTLGVGFAVNDSGIAIPAVALFVAIPLLLAASVRALELDETAELGAPPAPRRR